MKAVIFAGGQGTRLRPLTLEIHKPLVTVQKRPIISYLVDLFRNHRVDEIIVVVHRSQRADFEKWKKEYHRNEPIRVIIENKPLGTFGALVVAKKYLDDGEDFFVTNGDELKNLDLTAMKKFHKAVGGDATIALVRVDEPQHYGVAVCDGRHIATFIEKPSQPPSNYISSGLYIFTRSVFQHYPHGRSLKFSMVERDLFPKLAEQRALAGFKFDGQWFDCGTFPRWEKAILTWKPPKRRGLDGTK